MQTGRKLAAGSTIGRRIHICLSDDENGPCNGSAACEVCRNSPPFMPPSATISIRSAPSTQRQFQAQPRRRSGRVARSRRGIRISLTVFAETGSHPSDTTSRRLARVRRWLNLLLYPPYSSVCISKANIWTSKARLICFGGGLLIKVRQCCKSSSRPAVFNPAI